VSKPVHPPKLRLIEECAQPYRVQRTEILPPSRPRRESYGGRPHRGAGLNPLPLPVSDDIALQTSTPGFELVDCFEIVDRVLELLPDVVSTGAVLLGGIWWITNRREEVAKAEGRH